MHWDKKTGGYCEILLRNSAKKTIIEPIMKVAEGATKKFVIRWCIAGKYGHN